MRRELGSTSTTIRSDARRRKRNEEKGRKEKREDRSSEVGKDNTRTDSGWERGGREGGLGRSRE